jgi:hypothetical protein
MVNKGFSQMPGHIQIIGHISNMIIWMIPVIISIAVYCAVIIRSKNLEPVSASMDKNRSQQINTISAGIEIKRRRLNLVAPERQNIVGPTLNVINEASSASNTDAIEVIGIEVIQIDGTEQNTHPGIPQTSIPLQRPSSNELEASARAMKTNLLMLILFVLNYTLLLFPSASWRTLMAYICVIVLKFLVPVVTTISNFGPVRELMTVYFQSIFQP